MVEKPYCKVCGCTWDNACYIPGRGSCWWVDESETLCSHCYYGWAKGGLENEG